MSLPKGTNTFVRVPGTTYSPGGVAGLPVSKTLIVSTSPNVGSKSNTQNGRMCSVNATVTSSVSDPFGVAPATDRSVTITGTGDVAGVAFTATVPKGGTSANISIPAPYGEGTFPKSPYRERVSTTPYLYNLCEPNLLGAAFNSFSPATMSVSTSNPTSTLTDTYPGVTLSSATPGPIRLQQPNPFTSAVAPSGAPSGSVELFDGTASLGTCTPVSGTCDVALAQGLARSGSHSITAKYSYTRADSSVYTFTTPPITQVVTAITTNTPSLDTGSNPLVKGALIKSSGWSLNDLYLPSGNPAWNPNVCYPTGGPGCAPDAQSRAQFQWQRCLILDDASSCADISQSEGGTNGAWWGTRDADIGRQVRLKVTWNTVESVLTAFSGLTGLVSPTSVAVPVLDQGLVGGAPRVGTSVHSTFGTWKGFITGSSTVAFQWQRCSSSEASSCTTNVGTSAQWYRPVAADAGSYLRVRATLTTNGQSVSASSAVSRRVAAVSSSRKKARR
ncbi:MAG: Ig-like domain-containing protein [Actinomycetes bacterium]